MILLLSYLKSIDVVCYDALVRLTCFEWPDLVDLIWITRISWSHLFDPRLTIWGFDTVQLCFSNNVETIEWYDQCHIMSVVHGSYGPIGQLILVGWTHWSVDSGRIMPIGQWIRVGWTHWSVDSGRMYAYWSASWFGSGCSSLHIRRN